MVEKLTNYFKILSLYRTDYSASLHIRAMAKLIGTSHVALLPHLKRLEEQKILHSEKAGKNKQYLLNKTNILTKYYLTITEELATIDYLEKNFFIKKLAEHLNSIDTPNPLILFGSYADNSATDESDIDLFSIGTLTKDQANHIKKLRGNFRQENQHKNRHNRKLQHGSQNRRHSNKGNSQKPHNPQQPRPFRNNAMESLR